MMRSFRFLVFGLGALLLAHDSAQAQRRGGGGGGARPAPPARSTARTSVNADRGENANRAQNLNRTQNVNVNRTTNANVNRDVNVNVHRDVDVDVHRYGYNGCCYHPVATAVAVTAVAVTTAAIIGSMVHSIPPSCSEVFINGYTYEQCGSTWYQPQFVGTNTTYVVIAPPR
jgi:uncharacterized protein DUF6515